MTTGVGFQNETLPEVPSSGGTPAYESGEAEQGIRPTKWGKFIESMKETSLDSPVGFMPGFEGAWTRLGTQLAIESDAERAGKTKISATDANKLYPGLPKPFTEPVYPEIADMMYADHKRRERLRAWIDRGPETGMAFSFAAGATTAVDPVNLALNITGARVLSLLKFKPTLAATFGENLAGNLLADIPSYYQLKRERQAVTVGQMVGGAVAGATLGTGIAKMFDGLGRILSKTPDAVKASSVRAAVKQHELGVKTDVSPAVATTALRTAGAVQPGVQRSYVFQELGHPSERAFYVARDAETNRLVPLGRDYSGGLHAVDDGVVANNLAADPESVFTGRVGQVQIPADARFLNLDDAIEAGEGKAFRTELEARIGEKLELPEDASVRTMLDEMGGRIAAGDLPEDALAQAAALARELGYDGYRYVSDGATRHHTVELFDENRAPLTQEFLADKKIAPTMQDGERLAASEFAAAPEQSRVASAVVDQELEELKFQPMAKETEGDVLDPMLTEQQAQAERFLKQAAAEDPVLKAELEDLSHQSALDKQEAQVLKDFSECYLKGMI